MSSAHKYEWTVGGKTRSAYRAKWTGGDGRSKSKRGFKRKGDAESYAADREAEARHGVALGEARPSGKTTVKQWSTTWLEGLSVKPQSADSYGYALARILPDLGGRTLAGLRPSEVKAWKRALYVKYADSTADQTVAIFAMMLRAAVHDGLIDRSPLPPGTGGGGGRVVDPDELLSLKQVRAWGAALPIAACEMPVVAAQTGLRQGELLGLRLPSVDFLRRQVRVVEQMVSPKGAGVPTWGPPKTAAGVRTVPLPKLAAEALARHLDRFPAVEGEPIFRSTRGHRWRRSSFGDVWRTAKVEAGLPPWAHWHALRDVCASSLIRQGNDVRTVMAILGHISAEETLRTYSRLWPDAADKARQSLDSLWDEGHGSTTGTAEGS